MRPCRTFDADLILCGDAVLDMKGQILVGGGRFKEGLGTGEAALKGISGLVTLHLILS